MLSTQRITHVRVELALHQLRGGDGLPLLMLHGLGERTPPSPPAHLRDWPGPLWGLDFTGHGESTVPTGGGYTPEMLASDADAALAEIGPLAIFGRGVGAYAGLLLASGRATEVRGLIITDGPGLDGGGSEPLSAQLVDVKPDPTRSVPDPWALYELSSDVRPTDYVADHVSLIEARAPRRPAVFVDALGRPAWLRAALEFDSVVESDVPSALAALASTTRDIDPSGSAT